MLYMNWDHLRIIPLEFLKRNKTLKSYLFVQRFKRVHKRWVENFKEYYSSPWKRKTVYSKNKKMKWFWNLIGMFCHIQHTLSLDYTPTNYYRFRSLQNTFAGKIEARFKSTSKIFAPAQNIPRTCLIRRNKSLRIVVNI